MPPPENTIAPSRWVLGPACVMLSDEISQWRRTRRIEAFRTARR